MLTQRSLPTYLARRSSFVSPVLLLLLFGGALLPGCADRKATPPTPSPAEPTKQSDTVAQGTGSPGPTEALPPPPETPVPHPTREEMREIGNALKGASAMDPNRVLQFAEMVGDLERVEAVYRDLAARSPKDLGIQYKLADTLHRRLKLKEARKLYEALNRKDPGSPIPYLGLSDLERIDGNLKGTWDYLARGVVACQGGVNGPRNLLMLAGRYGALKDKKTQEKLLRQAAVLAPQSVDVILSLARYCQGNAQAAEARQRLNDLLTRDPRNTEARRLLASLIATNPGGPKDIELAGKLLVEIFQSGQVTPDDYMTMGELMERDNDPVKAGGAYITLLTMEPERVEARYRLARIYQKLGQLEYSRMASASHRQQVKEGERRFLLSRDRQLAQRNPAVHFAEAQYAEKTQDYRIAVIAYGLAAQLAPHDAKIRQARARFYSFLGWPPPAS